VLAIHTTCIRSVAAIQKSVEDQRTELDNHADTCVVGKNSALVRYNEDVGAANCQTVSAVVAYDNPTTGEVYMLTIHQAILIPKMKMNLLGVMQMRDNDIRVNDKPKHMVETRTEDHHCIVFPKLEDDIEPLHIPLSIHRVTSYFPTRKTSRQECENSEPHLRLDLTAESPPWEPDTDRFQNQEEAMLGSRGHLLVRPTKWDDKRIITAIHTNHSHENPDYLFGEALYTIKALTSTKRGYAIGPEKLAKNWEIGLSAAKRTLEATTQSGVRTILNPTLSRRFRTNDRQLRYQRIAHDVFTDTLESNVESWFRQTGMYKYLLPNLDESEFTP
jgi:hypothetical protein